jgi:hypothetical protein
MCLPTLFSLDFPSEMSMCDVLTFDCAGLTSNAFQNERAQIVSCPIVISGPTGSSRMANGQGSPDMMI